MYTSKLFACSFGMLFFTACVKPVTNVSPQPLVLTDSLLNVITLETVTLQPVANELLLNGSVSFDVAQVAQVFPLYGGTLVRVPVEIGDYVEKGALLAEIRSSEVAELEKEREAARHQLNLANRNLESVQRLYDSGLASERDRLEAEQEVAVAEAEQQRLEAIFQLHQLKGHATYQLTAPVSGFVIEKQISPNMQIRSDQADALFTLSGLSNVWVMADVYESDIRKVQAGMPVRITTLAYGEDQPFYGIIDKVYNLLDPETKTMKLRVRLNNESYLLKPGMFTNVYVDCQHEGQELPRIPARALIFDGGNYYVVSVDAAGQFELKKVTPYLTDERDCYIAEGLAPDVRIVGTNALLIYNALK